MNKTSTIQRGFTQQLMRTDAETHNQPLDGPWEILCKWKRKDYQSPRDKETTGKHTESTDLDSWVFTEIEPPTRDLEWD